MSTMKKRVTHLIGTALALAALAAILLGGGLSANAATHSTVRPSHHYLACDMFPPCHE
jgi:hypothetical protein